VLYRRAGLECRMTGQEENSYEYQIRRSICNSGTDF
jgi:hypothetical protein